MLYWANTVEKWKCIVSVCKLFIDFKKACNLGTEFRISSKLVALIKMCLLEVCSRVHIG